MARYIRGCRIRTNTGLKNMHLFSIYRGIKGFISLYNLGRRIKMITEKAKWKQEVVKFFEKYGLPATVDAYKVKKSSIYSWRKKLRDNRWNVLSLNEGSKRPKNIRPKNRSTYLVEFIKEMRTEYGDIGEKKIKILLDRYCLLNNIKTVSAPTIGRIIKERNLYFHKEYTHFGKIKKIKRKKKQRRCGYIPKRPGDLVQIDSISIFENNVKRYILTAVDLVCKTGFGYSYKSLSSKTAEDFMNKLERVTPFEIKRVQTDNGQEFHRYFDEYLTKKSIVHFFNYPRHPQHNAAVERFNRTLQDEFLNHNLDLVDVDLLNYKLINYLIFYNKERPHQSLDYISPADYLINNLHFSKMLWGSARY